jgi:hypothetical protein
MRTRLDGIRGRLGVYQFAEDAFSRPRRHGILPA